MAYKSKLDANVWAVFIEILFVPSCSSKFWPSIQFQFMRWQHLSRIQYAIFLHEKISNQLKIVYFSHRMNSAADTVFTNDGT